MSNIDRYLSGDYTKKNHSYHTEDSKFKWKNFSNILQKSNLNLNKTVLEADLLISKGWWIPEIFAGIQTRQLRGAAMNGNGSFFTEVNQQNLWRI